MGFSDFIQEQDNSYAIVATGVDSSGIENKLTRQNINSALGRATERPFITPYIGLACCNKILAYAGIILPQYIFLDKQEGEIVFDAAQYGIESGYFIYFYYNMLPDGYYEIFTCIVTEDELQLLLDLNEEQDGQENQEGDVT